MIDFTTAATAAGYAAGKASGTWVIDGNTSVEQASRFLAGYDDGDLEVFGVEPGALPTPADEERVLDELGATEAADPDGILDAYRDGFSEGFWDEVTRAAKYLVEG